MSLRFSTNNARLSSNRNSVNENKPVGVRKTKTEISNNENKPTRAGVSGVQRAPLSTVNHPNVRGLPKKSNKQKVTTNETRKLLGAPSKTVFTVYHDGEDQKIKDKTSCVVGTHCEQHTAVVKANPNNESGELSAPENQPILATSVRQPLVTLSLNKDTVKESPMILDLSINLDSGTKPPNSIAQSTCRIREDLLVSEYCDSIYEYLRDLEIRCQPRANYMKKQPDITNGMRSILVDWLVEVTEEYKLQTGTLYLAVAYIDRFLSCMSVLRGKLQLVGTASMFIASKFEEIYPPEVDEFVYITDDTYTKKQVLRMEQIILRVLAFDLNIPTVYYFLQYFFHRGKLDERTQNLALYLGELTLLEADPYLQFTPSIIAGSAICLARHALDQQCWPKELKACTGYSIEDLKTCLHYLHKSFANAKSYPQQAVREKYCSSKYSEVGSIPPPVVQPI